MTKRESKIDTPLTVGVGDAARLLGISRSTFWRWDTDGLLGPIGTKIGGKRLWSTAELEAWVAAGMPRRREWAKRANN
jgi:excisionase family DNA binding protein